jgi:hypothetical protein
VPIVKEKTAVDTALAIAGPLLVVGWVMSLIWVIQQPSSVRSAQLLFFVIAVYAVAVTAQVRAENRMDEVELAAARFGARWGLIAGVAFMAVLIILPPFQSLLTESADALRGFNGYPRPVEARMFMLGVVSTFVAQETFRSLLAAGWKQSKR